MILANLRKGQILRINKSFHAGRTYRVIGFSANKFGARFAICDWLEEKGYKSSHIIYASDLS